MHPNAPETEPSADYTKVHSSSQVLSIMIDAYQQKEKTGGDKKTTTQILDEISESGSSFDQLDEASAQESTYSIDVDIQQNFPHALVNDDLIYYDGT